MKMDTLNHLTKTKTLFSKPNIILVNLTLEIVYVTYISVVKPVFH